MRLAKLLLAALPALALASCSLLPQEEQQRSVPLIQSYKQSEYTLGYVQFGDVVLTETISCRYMPVSVELLSFPVGGEYYGEIYVQKGDAVHAGQLLAELNTEGLDADASALDSRIASLEMELRHLTERRDLEVASARRLASATGEDPAAAAEQTTAAWSGRIRSAQDSLTVARLRREELEEALARRRLYAGIDGSVTYVRSVSEGVKSVEGETVIRIADAASSVFSCATANYDLLPEGTVVTLTVKKNAAEAEVVSAASLGLEEGGLNAKGQKTVYLRLLTPDATLESGDRAALTLLVQESDDTLWIPVKALHSVGERTFVYQMDELGLKRMVDIEVGLISSTAVEVLSGLEEGENVIIG